MGTDENSRVIDIVGYLKHLWAHKVIFVITFVVVMAIGSVWTLTRPAQFDVTQTVFVTLATVTDEAQAMQQSASLAGTVSNFAAIASLPIVAQPVLDKNPGMTFEQLKTLVSVTPVGPLAMQMKATGEDPEETRTLVSDLTASWVAVAAVQMGEAPSPLRFTLNPVDEPVVVDSPRGRLIRLAASGVLALIASTLATALAAGLVRRRTA
ncbi:hypothetical protein [Tessaracoccus sp.]